jgi:phage terminase small subunit
MKHELTAKQRRFVEEYLVDLNASAAARRAGYSARRADQQGLENLRKPEIAAAIQAAMEERGRRTEITADRVLLELARIAFFDPRKLFNPDGSPKALHELDDDTAAAIAGLEVLEEFDGHGEDRIQIGVVKKYKVADKNTALTNAMRHLGLYKDKVELTGKNGGPVQQANLSSEEFARIAVDVASKV